MLTNQDIHHSWHSVDDALQFTTVTTFTHSCNSIYIYIYIFSTLKDKSENFTFIDYETLLIEAQL